MDRNIKVLLSFLVFTLVGCACTDASPQNTNIPKQDLVVQTHENFTPKKVSILAVGDNLIHDTLYYQARWRAKGQGYDFSEPYKQIEDYVESADIAVINQETPLASDLYPLANYPRFNSPKEVGEHMVKIGFDVFNYANNHAYDMGAEGLKATLDFMGTMDGVLSVGAYRNNEEKEKIKYIEKNGLKIAFLGFTEHTNGINVKEDSQIRVFKTADTKTMQTQVQQAKASCDIVVVSIHWGNENSFEPSNNQRELARSLAGFGADLIIGNHPHVLQGGEYILNPDGSKSYVFYSLGNFISAQSRPKNMPSGMLLVEFLQTKQGGQPYISHINLIPTVTHYEQDMRNIRIIPFEDYTEDLALTHGVGAEYPNFRYQYLKDIFKNVDIEKKSNT